MSTIANPYALFKNYPDIMGIKHLQAALRIGRSTAYNLVNSGEIKSFRIGATVKIPKSNVISYAEEICYTQDSSGQANVGCQEGVCVI